ncbi:MAG: glycosyltransferase family 39 protein [bacterium]|nr:glycosyltransferase family 39 protein [bacterium]
MNKLSYLFLAIIIFLAAFLRLYHIKDKCFFLTDEAANSREAIFVKDIFNHTIKSFSLKNITNKERVDYISNNLGGLPLTNPKPGHVVLIALFGSFTNGIKDYTSSLMSAVFGLATVILIFFLGKSLYSPKVGILSAFLLSISGYHLLYSREGFGEINTLFFFVLANIFYIQSIKNKYFSIWYLGLSGLFTGIAYSCHYRWILMPFFFYVYELYFFYRKKPHFTLENIRRFTTLSLTMLLPFAIYESFYHLLLIIYRKSNIVFPFRTYIELLYDNIFRFGSSVAFNIQDFIAYPFYLFKLEGIVICILLLYGIYKLIRNYTSFNFIIFFQFFVSLIFFGLYSADFPRFFVIALPSIFLIISKALDDYIKPKNIVFIVILVLICIFSLPNINNTLNLNSGLRKAFNYLSRQGVTKHITTHEQVSFFYVKDPNLVRDIRNIESYTSLKNLYNQDYRYLLVDVQKYITKFPHFPFKKSPLLIEIESRAKPIFTIKENRGLHFQFWFEHCIVSFLNTLNFFKNIDKKDISEVRIYDLKDFFRSQNL